MLIGRKLMYKLTIRFAATVSVIGIYFIFAKVPLIFEYRYNSSILATRNVSIPVLPIIYVVTPTYYRHVRLADLTRLANTLAHVPKILWILIEDGEHTSNNVKRFLNETNIQHTYFAISCDKKTRKGLKGIGQRNAALAWIRTYHEPGTEGVLYFADDDNSYNIKLFEEMRYTHKISMWPVGLSGGLPYERPLLQNGKVVGFKGWFSDKRTFAVDMAGFAINVRVLFDYPNMTFPTDGGIGFQETDFIQQCCKLEEIEPKAENCTKIYVWHTQTKTPGIGQSLKVSDTIGKSEK